MADLGFPGGSDGKESTCTVSLISGLGRSPGEGHATHSCILAWRIPMDRGSGRLQSMGWQRVVDTTEQLSIAWLIYHVVFISVVQQNDSVIHIYIYIFFSIFFIRIYIGY